LRTTSCCAMKEALSFFQKLVHFLLPLRPAWDLVAFSLFPPPRARPCFFFVFFLVGREFLILMFSLRSGCRSLPVSFPTDRSPSFGVGHLFSPYSPQTVEPFSVLVTSFCTCPFDFPWFFFVHKEAGSESFFSFPDRARLVRPFSSPSFVFCVLVVFDSLLDSRADCGLHPF